MERTSRARPAFALAFAIAGCGSAPSPETANADDVTDVDASSPSSTSSSTWRERFKRPGGTTPQRPPGTSAMGPFSTEERTSNASEKKRAKELFTDGLKLMDAERYEEACPKFRDAHEIVPGGVVLLRLSQCLEAAGDIPSACEAARASVVMLERKGGGSAAPKLKEANTRIEELKCR